jgi:nitrate reductase gamma subunit
VTPSVSAAFFTYGPILAVFGFAGAWMYRWGILRNDPGPAVADVNPAAEAALALGFVMLFGGHAITAAAPGTMRALLADLDRVAVIEGLGLVGAMLFAFGVGARLLVRVQALRAGVVDQAPRVAVLALLFLVTLTGIALTVEYRWITAWYAYISAPYVRSILMLEPATDAVVASPLLVRVHIALFMLLAASWPMAGLPLEEIFPVRGVARRILESAPAGERR